MRVLVRLRVLRLGLRFLVALMPLGASVLAFLGGIVLERSGACTARWQWHKMYVPVRGVMVGQGVVVNEWCCHGLC